MVFFSVCFKNWVLCINLFRFILYCFHAPPPPPAQLGPLCFFALRPNPREHFTCQYPEPVRQTSKSRASSGFSGGGSAAAEVCYSWVGVGVGPFKWQQYYGCLKRTIAGNRFVFCLFFNQDATYFSFSILLPASLISCFSVLYKYGKYEKSLSFPP